MNTSQYTALGVFGGLAALYVGAIVIPSRVRECEVYPMTSADGTQTVNIQSCPGGLFGHRHKLVKNDKLTQKDMIVFDVENKNELGHKHVGYNPHVLDLKTGKI